MGRRPDCDVCALTIMSCGAPVLVRRPEADDDQQRRRRVARVEWRGLLCLAWTPAAIGREHHDCTALAATKAWRVGKAGRWRPAVR